LVRSSHFFPYSRQNVADIFFEGGLVEKVEYKSGVAGFDLAKKHGGITPISA